MALTMRVGEMHPASIQQRYRLVGPFCRRVHVRPRIKRIVAGLITLSMVVFGQVCALRTLASPPDAIASIPVAEAESFKHEGCTSACGGGGAERDEQPCPSGASMCCSTWAPPGTRLSLALPVSLRLQLTEAWLAGTSAAVIEDRAQAVAFDELARPPGSPHDPFLVSSLSRRGPPARA